MLSRLKNWARAIKRDIVALWFSARDRRTPLAAKLLAAVVVGYALSPVDLIPDFIPILGYLDDLLLLPLGIMAAVALIPEPFMGEFRKKAEAAPPLSPSMAAAIAVVAVWLGIAAACLYLVW